MVWVDFPLVAIAVSSIMVWELVPGVWKEIVTGAKGARPKFVKNTKVCGKLKTEAVCS